VRKGRILRNQDRRYTVKLYGIESPTDNFLTPNASEAIDFFYDEIDRVSHEALSHGKPTITAPWRDEVDRLPYDSLGTEYRATIGAAVVTLRVVAG
jgi:hypothetical protein